jgi:hypothetical protein
MNYPWPEVTAEMVSKYPKDWSESDIIAAELWTEVNRLMREITQLRKREGE